MHRHQRSTSRATANRSGMERADTTVPGTRSAHGYDRAAGGTVPWHRPMAPTGEPGWAHHPPSRRLSATVPGCPSESGRVREGPRAFRSTTSSCEPRLSLSVQEQATRPHLRRASLLLTVPTAPARLDGQAGCTRDRRGHRASLHHPLRRSPRRVPRAMRRLRRRQRGFATGDYKVNREGAIQVEVAEILWNASVAEALSARPRSS